jgi:hypothetical protein
MGIFSGDVVFVGQMDVYLCELSDGRHATILSAEVEVDQDSSLTLPVPIARHGDSHGDFEFMDPPIVSGVFDILRRCFSSDIDAPAEPPINAAPAEPLFAPTIAHIKHAAGAFAPNPKALNSLPAYWDCAFVTVPLRKAWGRFRLAPFGYAYESAQPNELFFPLVHTDRTARVDHVADFDHSLYYQQSVHFGHINGWENAAQRPESVPANEPHHWPSHILDARQAVQRQILFGNLPNCDMVLKSTRIVDAEVRAPWDLLRSATPPKTKLWELLPEESPHTAAAGEQAS